MEYESNYQKLCVAWREKFLTWDHEGIYRNLNLEGCYPGYLEIPYFGQIYRIDRTTGIITRPEEPGEEITFNTQMAIYNLFYYSKSAPRNSGEWIPFRQVKGAAPFERAFCKMVLEPFARAFSGKKELLEARGRELGFVRISRGDVGFYAEAFPCIPLQFIFWDGDDEFPAQANILFDKNITDFTHEETVVLLAEDGVARFLNKKTQR